MRTLILIITAFALGGCELYFDGPVEDPALDAAAPLDATVDACPNLIDGACVTAENQNPVPDECLGNDCAP